MARIFAAFLFLALAGCGGTPYQDMGWRGGVEAQQITDRTVRISARGNGYTAGTTTQEHALLKAAETTLNQGYRYFQIVGAADASRQEQFTTSGYSSTTLSGTGSYMTARTTYTPGQTINTFKPGQDIFIRMYRAEEIPAGAQDSFMDAEQIKKYLGQKYIQPAQ